MTQANSRQRCKVDTIGDQGLETLFAGHKTDTLEAFRLRCIELIESSSGKKETKTKFVAHLNGIVTKDKMLTVTTNYILAGQGFGV